MNKKITVEDFVIANILLTIVALYIVSPADFLPLLPFDDLLVGLYFVPLICKKIELNISKCKICGAEANGFKLCNSCYYEKMNKSNNKRLPSKSGNIVKSKSELLIDEHLFNKGYNYKYEEELSLQNENGDIIVVHPDFCIIIDENKIYVEYWGFDEKNKKYTKIKNEKLKLYQLNGITLINLYESTDGEQLREALDKKLLNYEKGKINY